MHRTLTLIAVLTGLTLAACEEPRQPAPPPPPPAPPNPDLPMTAQKARDILAGLPQPCIALATLKMAMFTCDERLGKAADHATLRTELRDLATTLQPLDREAQMTRCTELDAEMRAKPKPQACWDLGNGY